MRLSLVDCEYNPPKDPIRVYKYYRSVSQVGIYVSDQTRSGKHRKIGAGTRSKNALRNHPILDFHVLTANLRREIWSAYIMTCNNEFADYEDYVSIL